MVEGSVRVEFYETGGRVAVATFLRGNDVMVRFAGGDDAVMATATATEYFGVINEAYDVKPYG